MPGSCSIEPLESATVTLTIPQQSGSVGATKAKPTAAVLVKTTGGKMSGDAVNATVHMSYGSVRDVPVPLTNISEGGVALGTNRTSDMTGPVQLRMQLPGLNRILEAKGEFVWTNNTGRVGIRFTTIAPLAKSDLETWLSRQLEITAPNLASAGSRLF